ncbi:Reverse_transcriptase (RNA-dependent DNA polymerase) [Hexamita inflata]|uniref:Reverse_transcriptase (RNA-dependent DNA polymerase) n=1 Tax=Hexamita inflata TaxID=28002 RepID=A0ABP1IJY0_9EUKA
MHTPKVDTYEYSPAKQKQYTERMVVRHIETFRAVGRASDQINRDAAGERYEPISEEERIIQNNIHFPQNKPIAEIQLTTSQDKVLLKPATEDLQTKQVKDQIQSLQWFKAAGPSGFGPLHILYATRTLTETFVQWLTDAFNELKKREQPCTRHNIFKFEVAYIPKKSKGTEKRYRSICLGETVLQVFHKLFERQLNSKITHHHRQYVGRKSGLLSAKLQVAHMLNNNQNHFAPQNDDTQTDTTHNSAQDDTIWDVVKVDIQNAFNELPHDQIRQALENSAISLQDRRYIFNHLQSRWADDIPRVRQGVSTGDVISQKLFLACVDPILFELDEKGYRAVMYADDLTVLHKRGEYHQTVELLANMFQKIGLVINKDKCEGIDPSSGNTTGVIEFLGQNIGINSEPIAVQIQKQLQTRIKALQKYDIPKFYQYLIFKQCIIPSANYGPFLEASITETQLADAKDKYDYIDIMLAEAMEEILESDLPTKDLLDVMILSKDDGGLDLITPGAYFDLMIQNRDMAFQDPTKVNKETRDFFSKNRHEFINSKQYPFNVKSEVKLGHCLDNYYQITNKGFQYLVDMRFNKKQKYVSLDTKCDLCNCKNDIYHELNCKKLQRNHILTHDYFVRQLADKMINANKVREVKEVSKNNNNRTDQKHKADISFIKDGKQQFFDIGISWDTERYFAVKQKHYQTETVNGQPITCTPIIIGKDTTVHPESLAALRQVGIEDSWLYQQVGILMSNYREQTDYVFRKKTRKAQDQPKELNIQEIDQTEEFSSLPVQPKNQNTNKSEAVRKSQTLQTQPKQAPQTQIKRKHFGMKTLEFLRDQDIKIERQIETDLTEQDIKIERDVQTLSQIEEQASEIRQMVAEEKFETELYQKRLCSELEDIIQNYAEDHANMKITKIQSNLMIIVQSFYKRNLISKDHCGIFQQKIKSLKKIENIEDILKQREQNLPAQQEQPKRSQSVKPHKGTEESSIDSFF